MNSGDIYLTTTISAIATPATFVASSIRDSKTGDLTLKLVNGTDSAKPLRIELAGAKNLPATATATVLAGNDANVVNDDGRPPAVWPRTASITIAPAFDYEASANSLTVIRINTR